MPCLATYLLWGSHLLLSKLELKEHHVHPEFSGFWDPNSSAQACRASILPTEASFNPINLIDLILNIKLSLESFLKMLVPVKEVIQSDRGKRLLQDEYSTPLVISERTLQGQLEHKGPI